MYEEEIREVVRKAKSRSGNLEIRLGQFGAIAGAAQVHSQNEKTMSIESEYLPSAYETGKRTAAPLCEVSVRVLRTTKGAST